MAGAMWRDLTRRMIKIHLDIKKNFELRVSVGIGFNLRIPINSRSSSANMHKQRIGIFEKCFILANPAHSLIMEVTKHLLLKNIKNKYPTNPTYSDVCCTPPVNI